jgi:hypothetical protein
MALGSDGISVGSPVWIGVTLLANADAPRGAGSDLNLFSLDARLGYN